MCYICMYIEVCTTYACMYMVSFWSGQVGNFSLSISINLGLKVTFPAHGRPACIGTYMKARYAEQMYCLSTYIKQS